MSFERAALLTTLRQTLPDTFAVVEIPDEPAVAMTSMVYSKIYDSEVSELSTGAFVDLALAKTEEALRSLAAEATRVADEIAGER